MKKAPKRQGFYNEKEDIPDYQPNYEFIAPRSATLIPRYHLMVGRLPTEKKQATANESVYNYDQYVNNGVSHIYPRYACVIKDND